MNPFHFNEHGVCMDADNVVVIPATKNHYSGNRCTISLAMIDSGKWVYGYDYQCYTGGGCSGPSNHKTKWRKQYTTRVNALMAGIDSLISSANRYALGNNRESGAYRAFINKLIEYRDNHCQSMKIDASRVSMEPTSIIMVENHAVDIRLELTTMTGKPWPVSFNGDFGGFDVQFREMGRPATLGKLIDLILHRRRASEQYVAEQNGVRVMQYKERPSFRQSMSQIEFGY